MSYGAANHPLTPLSQFFHYAKNKLLWHCFLPRVNMKYINHFFLDSIILSLAACGSSSSSQNSPSNKDSGELRLFPPLAGKTLSEDFPLAKFISHPEKEKSPQSVTGLHTDGLDLYIHQSEVEYGVVDTGNNSLPYQAITIDNQQVIDAHDIESQDDTLWYVSGDNRLRQYNTTTMNQQTWEIANEAQLSEVAISRDDPTIIWNFDKEGNNLYGLVG